MKTRQTFAWAACIALGLSSASFAQDAAGAKNDKGDAKKEAKADEKGDKKDAKADDKGEAAKGEAAKGDDKGEHNELGRTVEGENQKHDERMAKLDRLDQIAKEKNRPELTDKVARLREKENARHTRVLERLAKRDDMKAAHEERKEERQEMREERREERKEMREELKDKIKAKKAKKDDKKGSDNKKDGE